jgi:hypothetical protein
MNLAQEVQWRLEGLWVVDAVFPMYNHQRHNESEEDLPTFSSIFEVPRPTTSAQRVSSTSGQSMLRMLS